MARWFQAQAARRCGTVFILGLAVCLLVPNLASADPDLPANSLEARSAAVAAAEEGNVAPANAETDQSMPADHGPRAESPSPRGLDPHARYRMLIQKEVARTGLAPEIAEAVMAVESGYNPGAIGGAGEIGLMQILPSTARMLGFLGTNGDLAVPETNIHYGVAYLAQAWRLAGGDLCTAVMKYRAGHGESRFSYLSVNYCLAVRSKLAARGFRVTGPIPLATFGEARSAGCKLKCIGGSRIGRVNLAALNSQLSALVVQVRAGR